MKELPLLIWYQNEKHTWKRHISVSCHVAYLHVLLRFVICNTLSDASEKAFLAAV